MCFTMTCKAVQQGAAHRSRKDVKCASWPCTGACAATPACARALPPGSGVTLAATVAGETRWLRSTGVCSGPTVVGGETGWDMTPDTSGFAAPSAAPHKDFQSGLGQQHVVEHRIDRACRPVCEVQAANCWALTALRHHQRGGAVRYKRRALSALRCQLRMMQRAILHCALDLLTCCSQAWVRRLRRTCRLRNRAPEKGLRLQRGHGHGCSCRRSLVGRG